MSTPKEHNESNSNNPTQDAVSEIIPDKAYGIALLALDGMGPARIERLSAIGSFQSAWDFVKEKPSPEIAKTAGVRVDTARKWKQELRDIYPEELYEKHKSLEIACRGDSNYPPQLSNDMEPPAILFGKGEFSFAEIFSEHHTVGIVGTRNCTRYGSDIAYELGRELSLAGIVVISGLAIGIDYAAHFGSTSARENNSKAAPSVAVVGSGLDIIYPKRSERLFELVAKNGVVISEAPLGSPPKKWRFPSRNRIIAGLSDLLIIVESHRQGGALITAEEAGLRGKSLMAVPGSIRSPASLGANQLIADGCQPLTEVADVFSALDLIGESSGGLVVGEKGEDVEEEKGEDVEEDKGEDVGKEAKLEKAEQILLDAFCWEVVDHEALLQRSGLDLKQIIFILESLIQKGWVARRGLNYERKSSLDL